jgi:hypothetical protein
LFPNRSYFPKGNLPTGRTTPNAFSKIPEGFQTLKSSCKTHNKYVNAPNGKMGMLFCRTLKLTGHVDPQIFQSSNKTRALQVETQLTT